MTETRSFSNSGLKLITVNGASPGFDPPAGGGAAVAARGCTTTIEPLPTDDPSPLPASSTQIASTPGPLAPRSSGTRTAATWPIAAMESAVVRQARTCGLSSTSVGDFTDGVPVLCPAAVAGTVRWAAAARTTDTIVRKRCMETSRRRMLHRVGSTAMNYRRLGSTGLRISPLGLGCGNFGGIGSAPAFFGMGETEVQAFDLMDRAFDAGINFFDTANAYGGGRSESYIGRWLQAKGSAAREQLVVSSKVFNPVGPGPNDRGLSRRHILQQVDESLTRLQTDRLD